MGEAKTSRVWPGREYLVGMCDLDLVIRMTWHLPGLNSIFKSTFHSWRVLRLSLTQQACLVTVCYLWLFLAVPWDDLQCVIAVFPDHTHLLL